MGVFSTFGDRIAHLRKEMGWSQQELADQTEGFNRDHIVKLENNKVKNPNPQLLNQLITLFGTSWEWLQQESGPKYVNGYVKEDAYIYRLLDLLEDSEQANLIRMEVDKLVKENLELKNKLIETVEKIRSLRKR